MKDIFDNSTRIKEIGDVLIKLEKQNEEIRQEIYNLKEIAEPLQEHLQQMTRFEYVNNLVQRQPQQNKSIKQQPMYTSTQKFPQKRLNHARPNHAHQRQMTISLNTQAPSHL